MSPTIWLVLLSLIVIFLIKAIHNARYVPAGAPPMAPGALPLLGHMLQLSRNPVPFLKNAKEKLGGIVTINIFGMKSVMVLDRAYLGEYFSATESQLSFDVLAKESAIILAGYEQLEVGKTSITRAGTFNYDEIIESTFVKAIEKLPANGQIDLNKWSRGVLCQLTMKVIMGRNVSEKLENDLLMWETVAIKAMGIRRFVPNFLAPLLLYIPNLIKLRESVFSQIEEVVATLTEKEKEEIPYLAALKKASVNETFSNRYIAGQVATTAFAAITNSANAVAEALIRVALHPSEATELAKKIGGPDFDAAASAWSMECARLSNSLINPTRIATTTTGLGDYVVPKDSLVFVASDLLSKDPQSFSEPTSFLPERFSSTTPTSTTSASTTTTTTSTSAPTTSPSAPKTHPVLVWGGGRHLCPGKKFALSEMKGALKIILTKLKLTPISVPPITNGFNTAAFVTREGPAIVAFEKK